MKRGIFQVHANTRGGGVALVDVLDLDELSFRAWLLGHLQRGGILAGPRPEEVRGRMWKCTHVGRDPRRTNMPNFRDLATKTTEPTTDVGRQVAEDLSRDRDRKVVRDQVEQQLSAMATTPAERTLVRDIAEGVAAQGQALEAADVQFLVESLREGTLPSKLRAQFKVTETAGRRRGRPDAMPLTSAYQPSEGSGVKFRPTHDKLPTADEILEREMEKARLAADDPLRETARRTMKQLYGLGEQGAEASPGGPAAQGGAITSCRSADADGEVLRWGTPSKMRYGILSKPAWTTGARRPVERLRRVSGSARRWLGSSQTFKYFLSYGLKGGTCHG